MAKRSDSQESITLALELLKRIPKHGKVSASTLHKQLQEAGITKSLRTVQRNLEILSEHFDIERDDRSKPYGYSWKENTHGLFLAGLTPQESLLLSLAENYLSNLLPSNITASLSGFFNEAQRTLSPFSNNTKEREWLKKVRVVSETQPLLPPQIDEDVLKSVSDALYNNQILSLEYCNAKQEDKKVSVLPLGLAQQGARLYLVCRFEGYNNERSLAIHRIKKANVSTFSFDRPKEFKLSQYDADGRFGFGEGEKQKIEFNIKKEAGYHLLETPLSDDQLVVEHENYYQISATVIDSKQLQRWLKGFGSDIENIHVNKK